MPDAYVHNEINYHRLAVCRHTCRTRLLYKSPTSPALPSNTLPASQAFLVSTTHRNAGRSAVIWTAQSNQLTCSSSSSSSGPSSSMRQRTAALPPFCRLLLSTLHASFHSSSSTPLASQAAEIITQAELQAVPQSTVSSDRLLSSTQRESLAIFRRFNISQPQLQGQVILAKVLRSTRQQVLVDPGYYGLNWVSKQVRPCDSDAQPQTHQVQQDVMLCWTVRLVCAQERRCSRSGNGSPRQQQQAACWGLGWRVEQLLLATPGQRHRQRCTPAAVEISRSHQRRHHHISS